MVTFIIIIIIIVYYYYLLGDPHAARPAQPGPAGGLLRLPCELRRGNGQGEEERIRWDTEAFKREIPVTI